LLLVECDHARDLQRRERHCDLLLSRDVSGTLRIAVDAGNLARDRRGMGRLARSVLREAARDPQLAIDLLADARAERAALRAEFAGTAGFGVGRTARARERGRYDVVWYPFNGMRFRASAPTLALVHDVFAFTEAHPERIARYREQAPIRRTAREATAIATTTEWNRREIARELGVGSERIEVIPPVADAIFVPGSAAALPAAVRERRYVLAVGGGEARKNLGVLIEACARAFAPGRERLILVGSLGARSRRRVAELGLAALHVDASDGLLRDLYRGAALVAVPSRAEGFGLVAVEAMACGAAVLASDVAGLREATRGAAGLLPPDDVPLWAAAIRTLLDDDARRAALAARATAQFGSADRSSHARAMVAAIRRLAT